MAGNGRDVGELTNAHLIAIELYHTTILRKRREEKRRKGEGERNEKGKKEEKEGG